MCLATTPHDVGLRIMVLYSKKNKGFYTPSIRNMILPLAKGVINFEIIVN
jgi:hypothetical protein